MTVRPAQAQSETVLYTFSGNSDGRQPESSLTPDGAGNFYGTTFDGGLGFGTVFGLSPNGSGGWNQTVLYSFTGGADGSEPNRSYLIFDRLGNFYGTAGVGGAKGFGVVFKLSPKGKTWKETVLYSFQGGENGAYPINGLIMDAAGNLFGITEYDGSGIPGTVYELSLSKGKWTEKVIYSVRTFTGGLTMDAAGNIFGVGYSTVFELSPNGNGGWTPDVLYTFKSGNTPSGTPVLEAGSLYGTTVGTHNLGTVYKLTPGKKGNWTKETLYSFKGRKDGDGSNPLAGILFDTGGNIYGTTTDGGTSDLGTVFELVAPSGAGSYQEKVLVSFNGTDGNQPVSTLTLDSSGNLFGTTLSGGPNSAGIVFEVTP